MDTNTILLILMLLAMFLSLVSIIMVTVFLLKTNSKIKSFSKYLKLYSITSLVDKVMQKDKQYENLDVFYQDYLVKKPESSLKSDSKKMENANP